MTDGCACGCGGLLKYGKKFLHGHILRTKHLPHVAAKSVAERFWSYVSKSDGCWLWTGVVEKKGYGQLGVPADNLKGWRNAKAHRVSWELHNGPIAPGLHVLHHCDVNYPPGDITNRRCVRPDHLWLGTIDQNNIDMRDKGRASHGEGKRGAKLTEDQVREIRLAVTGARGELRRLALLYHVSDGNILQIVQRRTWRHVD